MFTCGNFRAYAVSPKFKHMLENVRTVTLLGTYIKVNGNQILDDTLYLEVGVYVCKAKLSRISPDFSV